MKLARAFLSGAALCVTWGMSHSTAQASGFSVVRFGGESGHPVADNATALYFNPAALTRSQGTHVYLDGTFAYRTLTYTHAPHPSDQPEPAGAEGANSGKASLFNILAGPMLGVTTQFSDLTLGAGIFVPFGGRAKFDTNDRFANDPTYPGLVDGPQRWFGTEGEFLTLYYTLALAYRLGPLSLGLSGALIQSSVKTTRARVATGTNDISQEGRSYLDVQGLSFGFAAGVMYEAIEKKLWIGASYTSKPAAFSDEMKLNGELLNFFPGSDADTTPVDLHQNLPDTYRLGGAYRTSETVELRLSGELVRWSNLENQCVTLEDKPCDVGANGGSPTSNVLQNVVRNWRDTFGIRAGASYWLNPETELSAGAGYSSNAVPDKTLEPTLPDFDEIRLTLGARIALSELVRIGASYTHSIWLPRDTAGNSALSTYAVPSKQPDSGGKYTQSVGAINANVDFAF